jgi:hypothetical protein
LCQCKFSRNYPLICYTDYVRIPNLPFFYLVFRAWSHWRALSGGQHLQFLLDKKLVKPQPSPILDQLYSTGKYPFDKASSLKDQQASKSSGESMVLHISDGKRISEALEIPELYVELDRAVWQVGKALEADKELKGEKERLDTLDASKKEE